MPFIDRFEGDLAILEGEEPIPRKELPAEAKEGDIVERTSNGAYYINAAASDARRAALQARLEALIKKHDQSRNTE